MSILRNQSEKNLLAIFKLFFDDIEEIFLHTISFRFLHILLFSTGLLLIGVVILQLYRSNNVYSSHLNSFIYALIVYDSIQLLSLVALKYNSTEQFFNQLCRWPYYMKSAAESGQCLTLIFLFALSRHQIRYFLAHSHLPSTSRINSQALTFVCLLFIVYDNNWITHLKVEKIHLVTLKETKYEINIQEIRVSHYDISGINLYSHPRFMADLDRYSQGDERTAMISGQHNNTSDEIIHNHKDGAVHEIIIKFPYDYLFNPTSNRTRRALNRHRRQQVLNQLITDKKKNNSYYINRCTYGQKHFFLSNFLSLIHSVIYLALMFYYLVAVYTYKVARMNIDHQQHLHEKSLAGGRRKSAERHKQSMLIIHLKRFLYLITYSHLSLALLRLIYTCSLTVTLCLVQTPFKWLPVKIFFYSLFLITYVSIPLRMGVLFIYLFQSQFSAHIYSIFFYTFHTKLRFSWKLQKPTICFRLKFIPYPNHLRRTERLTNPLVIDLSSSIDEDHSNMLPNDSVLIYDENSSSYHGVTTAIMSAPSTFANESTPNTSATAKL